MSYLEKYHSSTVLQYYIIRCSLPGLPGASTSHLVQPPPQVRAGSESFRNLLRASFKLSRSLKLTLALLLLLIYDAADVGKVTIGSK